MFDPPRSGNRIAGAFVRATVTTNERRLHHTRPRSRSRAVPLAAGVVLAVALLAGCTDDQAWPGSPPTRPDGGSPSATLASDLREVQDCDELVDAARPTWQRAVDSMWGTVASTTVPAMSSRSSGGGALEDGGAADSGAADSGAAEGDTSFSSEAAAPVAGQAASSADGSVVGTNNQERGVDEGDLVKTDGERLVSVVDGVLRVVELDGSPQVDGTLDLGSRGATELFLRGDEALVIGTSYQGMGAGSGTPEVWTEDGPGAAEEMAAEGMAADGIEADGLAADPTVPPTTTVPETTTVPPTTVPTTTVPPTTVPDTTVPDTTVPDTTVPDTTVPEPEPVPLPAPVFPVATTLTRVSLADPAAPTVLEAVDVEGSVAATRLIDGTVRVVVRSEPYAAMDVVAAPSRSDALEVVEELDATALVPRLAVDGDVQELGGCSDVLLAAVSEPADDGYGFSPTPQTVTVVTVGETLGDLQPVSVQGGAEVTYASTDALFVASSVWDQDGGRTDVHRFALEGDGPAQYTGSGSAPGTLLNQFSLSERDGALRVVTTVQASWDEPATTLAPAGDTDEPMPDIAIATPVGGTSGRLTILDTDGALDEIGHVDDLGPDETVRSVRFLEDLAYVVTFRQTDPLYALDLSDPTAPVVLGELKIPGFSEYLHPVGDGLLLGVGREVDPDTLRDEGLKISLFDVSDPGSMAEVDRIVLPGAYSAVSSDHHAFTWDPERSQAVVPVDRGCTLPGGPLVDGSAETSMARCAVQGSALVIGVQGGALATRGEWSHPSPYGQVAPLRTVVVGPDLWSVSSVGFGRTDAAAPTSVELLPS